MNKNSLTYAVFSLTLLLSAAMMFALQPMVGKMLLPIVGGTPAGWIVAMAFFQVMLLAGYLMAHLFSKVRTRVHGIFYVIALLTGIYFLPVNLSDGVGRISQNPGAVEVFLLLTFCVALPFIALSATSSTVQRLFTATGHKAAHDPYFLYAASNLGSFSGLLLYPLLIEPRLALSAQTGLLTKGYLLLLLLAVICLLFTKGHKSTPKVEAEKSVQPRKKILGKEYLYWMLLAFIPSSLLMGVTVYITTDVISVPMIWVLPLGLYLLTFIIAFGRQSFLTLERMENAHVYAVFIGIFMMYVARFKWLATLNGIWAVLLIFFVVALTCHMKLASRRPLEENSKDLTAFYLMMSVGGAIGGVLNSFIIPYTLDTLVEFPLILLFSLLLHPSAHLHTRTGKVLAALLVISLLCANTTPSKIPFDEISARFALAQVCVFLLLTSLFIKPKWKYKPLALLSIMFFMLSQFVITDKHELLRLRNFYGTIRVFEKSVQDTPESEPYHVRYMQHGTTVHGLQIIDDPVLETLPTAYFTKQGPLGDIFRAYQPKEVMVLGLGVGAMHCYTAPDRHFTFIEIDKDIVTVAKEQFSYLDACKNAQEPELIVGDGRLEVEKLEDRKYDLLIMDAFSSDSIPTHLLTEEAFKLYQMRLTEGGVIVINISNRYFDLSQPITATAEALGMETKFAEDLSSDRPAYSKASMWMLLTPKGKMPDTLPAPRWQNAEKKETLKPWTDDYTNLLSTLKF
jgi:spermidine synthase